MIVNSLKGLTKEDRVVIIVPRGAKVRVRNPAKKLILEINEGIWDTHTSPLEYATYYQATQILNFVNKEITRNILVFSYSLSLALPLEAFILLKQNKTTPKYSLGDAISNSLISLEETEPELWLSVLLDEVGGLLGHFREAVEEYLATGITVSSKAKIIQRI